MIVRPLRTCGAFAVYWPFSFALAAREFLMSEMYHVRVEKDYLVFSAAHFITFDSNVCERLHGHNYRVAAEVEGPLDENHYVIDFLRLAMLCGRLSPSWTTSCCCRPAIRRSASIRTIEKSRSPFKTGGGNSLRGDCKLLPVANTTTELLARYIGRRLLDDLSARLGIRPEIVRIELDECFGQSAVCELRGE